MPAYLVRLIGSREAVGLLFAEDEDLLPDAVDELCDPADCEFAEIPYPGGILWRRGARPLPLVHDWDREERGAIDVVGPYFLSEAWFSALTDDDLLFTPVVDPRDVPANDF